MAGGGDKGKRLRQTGKSEPQPPAKAQKKDAHPKSPTKGGKKATAAVDSISCFRCGSAPDDLKAKGVDWALYRSGGAGVRRPVGEACRPCWTGAKVVAGETLGVSEVIDLYKAGETDTVAMVDQSVMTAETGKQDFTLSAVSDTTEVAFDFTREIVVKTEADIKKDLDRSRLLKRHTKGLSSMGAPDETGTATEKVFFFKPEDGPACAEPTPSGVGGSRRVSMRVTRKVTFDTKLMESQKQAFEQQGQRVFEQGLNAMMGGELSALTTKLGAKPGTTAMQTYSEFLKSEVGVPDEEDLDGRMPAIEVDDGGVLEGVAAAAAMPPPLGAPRRGMRSGSFATPSRLSAPAGGLLGSGASSNSPLDDTASLLGSSMGDQDEDNLHEGELLAHWRAKVDLHAVMANTVDGRTVSGMRKRIKRLRAKVETYPDADALSVFEAQVVLCEKLRSDCVDELSWADAMDIVKQLAAAGFANYPKQTRLKLVSLKLASLTVVKNTNEYVRIASPMDSGSFDPQDPTLGAAEPSDKERVSEFIRIIVKGHVCGMIYKGADAKGLLFDLLMACLSIFIDADYLTCTAAQMKCASEVSDACAVLLHCIKPAEGATVLDVAAELERFVPLMGRTGHSAGHTLAAAVATTPYYKEQVDSLYKALPFAKEQLPTVRAAMTVLADQSKDPSTEQLVSWCQNLLMWTEGLPTQTAELSTCLKQKVRKVVAEFTGADFSNAPLPSKVTVAGVSELVQEASICFPSDREIEELQHAMAAKLQSIDSTDRTSRFYVACDMMWPEWTTASKVNSVDMAAYRKSVADVAQACTHVKGLDFKKDPMGTSIDRVQHLIAIMLEEYPNSEDWSKGRACLESLLQIYPNTQISKRLIVVSDVCAFLAACDAAAAASSDIADITDVEDGIELMNKVAAKLTRAMDITKNGDAEFLDLNLRGKNECQVNWAIKARGSVSDKRVDKARESMNATTNKLDKVKYATTSEKMWWEGLSQAAGVLEVSAHMQKMTEGIQWKCIKDLRELLPTQTEDYKKACAWGQRDPDVELVGKAEAVAERAAITLAEAAILLKLTTERNGDLLRQCLVEEVKRLRLKLRFGEKEDKALQHGVFQPMMSFLLGR